MWRTILRWLLATFAAGSAVVITIAIALYFVTDTQKVLRLVEKTVADETGGRLTIGSLEFNAFFGFTGKQIRFDPPNIDGSPRTTKSNEWIDIGELQLHYNLWSLLYGTIEITRAQINHGHINFSSGGRGSDFEGISAFRTKTRKDTKTDKANIGNPTPAGTTLSSISKSFWIPIRIKVSRIGFEHVDFRIKNGEQNIIFTDASAMVNATAYWHHANIESQIKIVETNIANKKLGSINAGASITIQANQITRGLDIKDLKLQVLDQIKSTTTISLQPSSGDENFVSYSVNHESNIELKIPRTIKQVIPLTLHTDGDIAIKIQNLNGKINPVDLPEKLTRSKINELFPMESNFLISGRNINASLPALGTNLKNLSFTYKASTKRSKDDNIELRSNFSQTSESVSINIADGEAQNRVFLDKTTTSLETNVHFPGPTTSTAKLELTISGAGIEGETYEKISLPISYNLEADSTQNLATINLHSRFKIAELLQHQLIATCTNQCEKFQAKTELELPSLEQIWSTIKSNASRKIIPKFLPENLVGKLIAKSEISGTLSKSRDLSTFNIFKNLKFKTDNSIDLSNLSTSIPANQLKLSNASFRLSLKGNEQRLSASANHNFDQLTAALDGKGKKRQKIDIGGLDLQFNSTSTLNLDRDLKDQIDISRILFNTSLGIRQAYASEAFEKHLSNITLTANGNANQLKTLTLESLSLKIPDLSTTIESSAIATISKEGRLSSFSANLTTTITDIPKDIVKGLHATGAIRTDIELTSKDMESATINGMIDIQGLSASITSLINPAQTVVINHIDGTIPLFQTLRFSSLKTLTQMAKKNAQTTPNRIEEEGSDGATEINDENIRRRALEYLSTLKPNTTGDTRLALNEDYGNFRTIYAKRRPIRINSIRAMNLSIEKIEIDAELSQNQLSINNAVASFLGGKLQAEFKFAFEEKPTGIKTSFHATRLNTEVLVKTVPGLKKRAKTFLSSNNPLVDGAVHLNYDLRTGDMQGGLNITSIGKDQLRMILYYIDPGDKDATINAIKTALHFGDVKLVSVPIRNGEIGLDVNLRLLAAPLPTPKLQGFPIAKLINNFREQGEVNDDAAH